MMMKRRNLSLSIMITGHHGIGKSTFINRLFNRFIIPENSSLVPREDIDIYIIEISCDGIKRKVNIVDTPGLGYRLDDTQIHENIINFIRGQYDLFLAEETKIKRNPEFEDTRVHCLLYFISPSTHGLKLMDNKFLQKVNGLVNIIPIIGKADGLTTNELHIARSKMKSQFTEYGIKICDFMDDQEIYMTTIPPSQINELIPFAVCTGGISSVENKKMERQYEWGVPLTENSTHNDFSILKEILLNGYCEYLIESTVSVFYEKYRTQILTEILPNGEK
ncbi:Cell division control protein 11 [Astathelohania contejeani]|uniref:Cell division control protein 11 n=1 Tax=Astathelohania contejeani TaxID=164912 RepID=A0ABQ7I0G5_9MICR|nr:Cell division control protein 11 [Thelohania contejeani]